MTGTAVSTFEGGSQGTTITTGNSGAPSGPAFSGVTIGTGAAVTYDNTQVAHGSFAMKVTTGASANAFTQWTSVAPGSATQMWFRLYFYAQALPGGTVKIAGLRSAASNACGFVQLASTGALSMVSNTGATMCTTTTLVPAGQWVRVEGWVLGDGSVGQGSISIYLAMDSSTASQTVTSAATFNTFGSIGRFEIGTAQFAAASYGPFWFDDAGFSSVGPLGPSPGDAAQRIFPGPAWQSVFQPWLPRPIPQGAYEGLVALYPSETGAGADAATVAADIQFAETGASAEALTVAAAVPLAETGAGADALTVAAAVPLAETGAGSDALTIAAAVPLAETGTGADAISVAAAVPLAEAGTSAEALTVAAAVTLAETGTGTAALTVAAAVTLAELGAAADALSLAELLSLAETGTGAEAFSFVLSVGHIGTVTIADLAVGALTIADTAVGAVTIGDSQP